MRSPKVGTPGRRALVFLTAAFLLAGAAAAGLFLAGCGSAPSASTTTGQTTATGAPDTTAASPNTAPTAGPNTTATAPTTAPTTGPTLPTLPGRPRSPWAKRPGSGKWKVTVTSVTAPATELVAYTNEFNEPPPPASTTWSSPSGPPTREEAQRISPWISPPPSWGVTEVSTGRRRGARSPAADRGGGRGGPGRDGVRRSGLRGELGRDGGGNGQAGPGIGPRGGDPLRHPVGDRQQPSAERLASNAAARGQASVKTRPRGPGVSAGERGRVRLRGRSRETQPERRCTRPRLLELTMGYANRGLYQSEKLVLYQILSVPFLARFCQSLVLGSASMRASSSSQRCLT